jgi:signal peptidase I
VKGDPVAATDEKDETPASGADEAPEERSPASGANGAAKPTADEPDDDDDDGADDDSPALAAAAAKPARDAEPSADEDDDATDEDPDDDDEDEAPAPKAKKPEAEKKPEPKAAKGKKPPPRRIELEKPKTTLATRALRLVFWIFWFALLPFVIACLLVWGLTPPSGVEAQGALAGLQSAVREQPVPIGIGIFALVGMALGATRRKLPLAAYAYPPLRADIPEKVRGLFERATQLLDEADAILAANEKAIIRELTSKEREKLHRELDALRDAMRTVPFVEDTFNDALVRADGEVDVRLNPWRKSELREYLESILVAVAVAFLLRTFVVEAFKIPSGSMIPTLMVGDHIFVNKFSYGPAIPYTNKRIWTHMPPERGDVIVFAYPEKPDQDFIKRVIALPGDKLEARNGHPILNGWDVPSCLVGPFSYDEPDSIIPHHEGDLYIEYLGDESYLTFYDRIGSYPEYQGPYYVKPGEVYVMGDNRNNSHDSRVWFGGQGGGVPFENMRGRALFVWLSYSNSGIDWSREGNPVMGRPRVPNAFKSLEPALDKCLRDRPPIEKTTPPPSAR